MRTLITYFADPGLTIFEEDEADAMEAAGDDYAGLDDNPCTNDGGCIFLTKCGVTSCIHCRRIVA